MRVFDVKAKYFPIFPFKRGNTKLAPTSQKFPNRVSGRDIFVFSVAILK
jgi:hypothetical protein